MNLKLRSNASSGAPTLFSSTVNNMVDLLAVSPQQTQVKESNVALIDGQTSSINIGEGCIIQKSVIGRNCTIGDKTKISNSIILGNCTIGSECIIQNAIILSRCVIGDKSNVSNLELPHGTEMSGSATQLD